MSVAPKLGIIAGGGSAPLELMAACRDMGRPFFVIALKGQADADFADADVRLDFGAFGVLKKICKQQELEEVVMLGYVRRPSVSDLKPDLLGMKVLARIGLNVFGDDGLLRAVSKAIEQECAVRVVGAHEVFGDILMPKGVLTSAQPDVQDLKDIKQGFDVARELGALDVGQGAIVQHGEVLGVEDIEGTDALIKRAGKLLKAGGGGVLVKCVKPQQDVRFDLPTLGPSTIENLAAAGFPSAGFTPVGFTGVAMQAGKSLFLEREKAIALANEKGIFIVGIESNEK